MREYLIALFEARTAAHMMHLASTSYSQHMALGDFYSGLDGLIDRLAEVYQGDDGLIQWGTVRSTISTSDAKALMIRLHELTETERAKFAEDPHIQNIMDEVTSLVDQTAYKLRFLK